jgi:Sec-independent protein translocase protein TatA
MEYVDDNELTWLKQNVKRQRLRRYRSQGIGDLFKAIRDILPKHQRSMVQWDEIIKKYGSNEEEESHSEDEEEEKEEEEIVTKMEQTTLEEENHDQNESKTCITIGLVGRLSSSHDDNGD